jgi:Chemoreceptor zinc-binding domain
MPAKAFFLMRLNDHIQYLKEIEATLSGEGNFQGTSHRHCKLGKWLYGEGPAEIAALNNNQVKDIFDSLLEPHERFHNISKQALEKKQGGDDQGAQAVITEMHVLSHIIAQKLLELDTLS